MLDIQILIKPKKNTKISVIPSGYMDGINIANNRDMFRTG